MFNCGVAISVLIKVCCWNYANCNAIF